MVSLLSRPLKLIRSPYIILSATYVIGQIMAQFITSASGLGMLLMVTLFPTLVSLGMSGSKSPLCGGGYRNHDVH